MTIKIVGNTYIVEFGFTMEQLNQVEREKEELLTICRHTGDEDVPVFAIAPTSMGTFSRYGFGLSSTNRTTGNVMFSGLIPEEVEAADMKDWVAEKMAPIVGYVEQIEENIATYMESRATKLAQVKDTIRVIE